MIAGRLHWRAPGAKLSGRNTLAAFDFDNGSLVLTEAGTKRRASLHVAEGRSGACGARSRRHRRAVEQPRHVQGSARRGEPHAQAGAHRSAHPERYRQRLFGRDPARRPALPARAHSKAHGRTSGRGCTRRRWIRCGNGPTGWSARRSSGFPEKVTAFRKEMAVHGRYGKAVSALRRSGAAHPLRRQRDELLRRVARPAASSSPIADSRDCSARTGRAALDELEALKRR